MLSSFDPSRRSADQHPEETPSPAAHFLPSQGDVREQMRYPREPEVGDAFSLSDADVGEGLTIHEHVADLLKPHPVSHAAARVFRLPVQITRQVSHKLSGFDVASGTRVLLAFAQLDARCLCRQMNLSHPNLPVFVGFGDQLLKPAIPWLRHVLETTNHNIQFPLILPIPFLIGWQRCERDLASAPVRHPSLLWPIWSPSPDADRQVSELLTQTLQFLLLPRLQPR
jgi:hypothetical protein